MPRNKIEDLRNHLFETIELLKDGDIDVERAKAIADVAHQINLSAKVEIDYLKLLSREGHDPVSETSLLSLTNNNHHVSEKSTRTDTEVS
jgi:hypothetical protein